MTILFSDEKISHFLADIWEQVEDFQREMTNLRLVRTQLTGCLLEDWGDKGWAPYFHTALVDAQPDL